MRALTSADIEHEQSIGTVSDEKIDATFGISPSAKTRLLELKERLVNDGHSASLSGLVENLLAPDFLLALEAYIRNKLRAA